MRTNEQSGATDEDLLLALAVLFGKQFADGVPTQLLTALRHSSEELGGLVLAAWRVSEATRRRDEAISSGDEAISSVDEVPIGGRGTLTEDARPSEVSALRASEGSPGRPREGATPEPAVPHAADEPHVSPLSVFDPEVDGAVSPGPRKEYARDEVRAYLVKLMVEKTGYPPDTFDEPLDFEADLGIDSIKQVEAMGEVRQHFELTLDESFRMRDYPTIDAATDYIMARLRGEPVRVVGESTGPPAIPSDVGHGSATA